MKAGKSARGIDGLCSNKTLARRSSMTVALDGGPNQWDVSSFDFLHPQMRIDPFPTFEVMREQSPVHWDGRAHWVFKYEDARSVLLGEEFGRSASTFQEQYFESLGAGQPYE